MRNFTKQRAKLERSVKAERRAYWEQAGKCEVCDYRQATETHEIACGCHRALAVARRCTWLAVCTNCNQTALTNYAVYPLERQLAIKWTVDRKHFDLLAFNELRGRAPTAITMADVIPHICREIDS